MLHLIEAEHFRQLLGQVREFTTDGGEVLRLRIDSVTLKPHSRIPDNTRVLRMPFAVGLTATEPTRCLDSLCTLELPPLGRVEGLMVLREASLGREPTQSYFQILFN
ncbi:hypothetical protein [Pseudomonas sp. MBLB4136]|uniref:hypothetical protein n=1 Tax=Pseudomonas sp. MBLB4136 TaxID=3451558 RepID=UPI003F7516AF